MSDGIAYELLRFRTRDGDVHDVTDEIARRAWLSGARVLAVRHRDIPGRGCRRGNPALHAVNTRVGSS